MKTKSSSFNTLPKGNGCENQPGVNSNSCRERSLSGTLKSVLFLIILFAYFHANAHVPPASNIRGPLRAYVSGANIIVTSEIFGDSAPLISYSFINNTSGASIVSQGPFQYNASTGIGTQTILVNPGSAKGNFRISLHVTTAGGTSESSKSVTVINSETINNNMLQLGGN